MKRALTSKVNPIPACEVDSFSMVEPLKPIPPEVNRRARTSAAMIGLAISMGASSLLLPQQGDSAIAADPTISTPLPTVPAATQEATPQEQEEKEVAVSEQVKPAAQAASIAAKPLVLEHKVQEWQPTGIETGGTTESARLGELSLNLALKTSQAESATTAASDAPSSVSAIKAASLTSIGHDINIGDTVATKAESDDIIPDRLGQSATTETSGESASNSANVNELLKAKQAVALNRLKESSNRLRSSLAEWRSEEEVNSSAQVSEPAVPEVVTGQFNAASEQAPASVEASPWQSKVAGVNPGTTPTVAEAISAVYEVQPGDTIDRIARDFQVSPAVLAKANGLDNPNSIRVSQYISIPQSETVSFSQSSALEAEPISPSFAARNQQLAPSKTSVPVVSSLAPATGTNNISVPVVPPANWTPTTVTTDAQAISLGTDAVPPGYNFGKFEGPQGKQTTGSGKAKENQVAPGEPSLFNDDTNHGPQANSNQDYNPYVERLRAEVLQLREQYRHQQGTDTLQRITALRRPYSTANSTPAIAPLGQIPEPNSASTSSTALNREFNPNQYSEAVQAEIQRRAQKRSQTQTNTQIPVPERTATPVRRQQLVATAPLGPEVYQPYNQPSPRLVTPELPALDGPDRYLPGGPTQSFNGYIWPSRGTLTSGYGWRWGRMHKGIDIAAPTGTPIFASAAGVVIYARWNSGGYGNLVDVRHADGTVTRYGHNSRILVQEGQVVEQGQQIALMGSTGYSTGPHCHFEIHTPGRGAVNPMAFLSRR